MNNDTKIFLRTITFFTAALVIVSEFFIWKTIRPLTGSSIQILLFLLFFILPPLFAAGIFAACYRYFHRQERIINQALYQIDLILSGDLTARLDSSYEGSIYKLFHQINILATSLNAQADNEQKAKKYLKDNISNISHQIKTPLSALSIYNSILQDDKDNGAVVEEFSQKSEIELDRINVLIQNLLKMSRLDVGIIVMDKQPELLGDLTAEIKQRFETRAARENKQLSFDGDPTISFYCDRVWFLEAIGNLIKNALDHTGDKDIITVKWTKNPDGLQILISDTGSGIHQEDLFHIFKRFYRSRFSKDTQGSGLGLSLAKYVIEAHDGNISVDSNLGLGSVFTLFFPL